MTSHNDSQLPRARQLGLVMTRTDNEMMVFDTETNELHHLNPLATAVWAQLDGTQSITAVTASVSAALDESISTESVTESVRLLATAGLLDGPWAAGTVANGSRRAFLRRAAVVGAASVPVVMSITAPSAAMAATGDTCGHPCVIGDSDNVCNSKCSQCNVNPAGPTVCCNPGQDKEWCWSVLP